MHKHYRTYAVIIGGSVFAATQSNHSGLWVTIIYGGMALAFCALTALRHNRLRS